MKTGILIESEGLVSLDLTITLARHSIILQTIQNIENVGSGNKHYDFLIVDSDTVPFERLKEFLCTMQIPTTILLTSDPISEMEVEFSDTKILEKPFTYDDLFELL